MSETKVEKVEVDNRLLFAADRMYDAVDSTLAALAALPALPPGLARLPERLRRARDQYDAAISEEVPR